MAKSIKLSDNIVSCAKVTAKILNRSVSEQIEHWVRMGKIAEKNPDLMYKFIRKILTSQQEAKMGGLEEYVFDKN